MPDTPVGPGELIPSEESEFGEVYAELNKLSRDGITSEELDKVKQQFEGGLVISLENMQSRMNRLAKMEIFENRLMTIREFLDIIDKIDIDDIHHLASYLAEADHYIETMIVPEKKFS